MEIIYCPHEKEKGEMACKEYYILAVTSTSGIPGGGGGGLPPGPPKLQIWSDALMRPSLWGFLSMPLLLFLLLSLLRFWLLHVLLTLMALLLLSLLLLLFLLLQLLLTAIVWTIWPVPPWVAPQTPQGRGCPRPLGLAAWADRWRRGSGTTAWWRRWSEGARSYLQGGGLERFVKD